MSTGRGAGGAAVTALSGLTLLGASTATWTERMVTRTVGDVEVTETVTTRGVEYARLGLLIGITAAAAGILLLALGAGPRRAVGLAVALAGIVAMVDVGLALLAVAGEGSSVTAAPGLALAGAAGMVVGGILAWRARQRAGLPSRFDIDSEEPGDEWRAAVEPEERDQ